uniref:Uncharacterized protein n=1 Tax=Strigamia maritima TaxID=126957 RepID=T1ILZ0_STRMM
MNYFLVLLLVICATIEANAELAPCFKKIEKKVNPSERKWFGSYFGAKCKEEHSEDAQKAKNCTLVKMFAALDECKKENPERSLMKEKFCQFKIMGIEIKESMKNFEKYKTALLSNVLDDRKKNVEDVVAPCAKIEAILLVLACAAAAAANETCLKEIEKGDDRAKATSFQSQLEAKCKKENPEFSDKNITHCYFIKMNEAEKECKKENPEKSLMKGQLCIFTKCGLEVEEHLKDFEHYKTNLVLHTLDEKKKKVEDTIAPCAKEQYFLDCAYKNLAEVCVEYKKIVDSLKEDYKF